MQAPILENKDYTAPSAFLPQSLLREARRQKALAPASVPRICVLDPDGDIVRALVSAGRAHVDSDWACYHTRLYRFDAEGIECGIVACAVGGAFAVLVAEELFASDCEFLISMTSAGQLVEAREPPYFILIERALRDEGTSYHYLPPSDYIEADPHLIHMIAESSTGLREPVLRGATWTTDAPFRETEHAIAASRRKGLAAVEMEAASLYAFARAQRRAVICLAHVSNRLGAAEGDFEKGPDNGAVSALELIRAAAHAWDASKIKRDSPAGETNAAGCR